MPSSPSKTLKGSRQQPEDGDRGREESAGILQTMDKSLEDIRSAITCRVCVRPLYEPFTIECGHTFCYSCLVSWFEKNSHNKTCPDCRAAVIRRPAPAYLVRDLTQIFSNRAELLPPGETTQEHKHLQEEESRILNEDKIGHGLFRGCFRHSGYHAPRHTVIHDAEDGVARCPRCAWEMDGGQCSGCGWPHDDDMESGEDLTEYEEGLMLRDLGAQARMLEYESSLVDDSESVIDIDSNGNIREHEDEESDESEVGSLDDFVVNDEEARPALAEPPGADLLHTRAGQLRSVGAVPSRRVPSASTYEDTEDDIDSGELSHDTSSELQDTILAGRRVVTDSSNDETDADSIRLYGIRRAPRSMSVDTFGDRITQDTMYDAMRNAGSETRSAEHYESDQESLAPDAGIWSSGRGRLGGSRRPPNSIGRGSRPSPFEVLQISSDSDEPISRPQARRRRGASSRLVVNEDEDDNQDEHENYVDASSTTMRNVRHSPRPSSRRHLTPRPSEQHSNNTSYSPEVHSGSPPRTRLDPVTSIPIRRDSVNMPGAFPPSFVSDQSQSQSQPGLPSNFRFAASGGIEASFPHRDSNGRRSDPHDQRQDHDFQGRRRREEQATQSTLALRVEQRNSRGRAAAKTARRIERRRLKAEQEARRAGRTG